MKHITVLLSLLLAACGSSSNSKQAANAVAGPGLKHGLILVDPVSQNVPYYVSVPGWYFTSITVDGLVPYTTVDGTVLSGVTPQLPALLNGQGYDAVIVVVGGYEWAHDRNQYAHQSPAYFNAHARDFITALDQTDFDGQVMWVNSLHTLSTYISNNAAALRITTINQALTTDDPQAIANAIMAAF